MGETSFGFRLQSWRIGLYFLFSVYVAACGTPALAQSTEAAAGASSPEVVTGQPFSAHKFTRRVHVEKDGTLVSVEERGHALLARDADGRVYLAGSESFKQNCDLPDLGKLPRCEAWGPLIFDPGAGVMWHWMDGERGDQTQYVKVDLRTDQIAEAERYTSALQEQPSDIAEPGISVQDLGEHDIEGIRAKGVRTTTVHNDAVGSQRSTIHEIWTSAQMHLVLKVVDGDPQGDEVISGLDHVSLSPESSLFQPPSERILRHWKDKSELADDDIARLAEWFVQ